MSFEGHRRLSCWSGTNRNRRVRLWINDSRYRTTRWCSGVEHWISCNCIGKIYSCWFRWRWSRIVGWNVFFRKIEVSCRSWKNKSRWGNVCWALTFLIWWRCFALRYLWCWNRGWSFCHCGLTDYTIQWVALCKKTVNCLSMTFNLVNVMLFFLRNYIESAIKAIIFKFRITSNCWKVSLLPFYRIICFCFTDCKNQNDLWRYLCSFFK